MSGSKSKWLAAAAASAASLLMTAGAAAQTTTVYSTGFENPPFANGSQLLGQDGWSTAIPPFLSPGAALISNATPAAGAQHVRVRGADMVSAAEVGPDYAAVGSYRRPVNYDAFANSKPVVTVSSAVRLDGPLATGDFFSASVAAITPNGTAGELALSSDGKVYGYVPGAGPGATPARILDVTLGQYHTLAVRTDFAANQIAYLVDGVQLGAPLALDASFTSDTLARGSIVTYARPETATLHRADYVASFDNFSVAATPEPAALAPLALAGLSLLRRRRR